MNTTFAEFFTGVWDYPPFRWQVRLAEQVCTDGWPAVLDLPTGSGKTAALDIALYHLAVDGGRTAARRVVMVVDRRVVVDQVGERARGLLAALDSRANPAVREVADALRRMVGDGPLLQTAVLRGASVRDDAWAQRPDVPVLAASTVDQVGSRLLFRGYGVSDGMKPVHAGLLGCDTLLLLDEVHLARPFADVLGQLETLRGPVGEVPRRFGVVQLSATPGASEGCFRLDPVVDRDETLAKRLRASKPATLERVDVKAKDEEEAKRAAMARRAAEHGRRLIADGRRAVAVVVNRVDTARRAWAALSADDTSFDVELVTGRMRPLDQADVLDRVRSRVLAGREDDPTARPVVLVATQCIEAGADFDFDALVTECASLDALRQRFGRLDRRGERASEAVVLARSDQAKPPDAVYGEALANTWNWLGDLAENGRVDFGIDAMEARLKGVDVEPMRSPRREAPVLMPAYLDQWVQTSPMPHADPDVALFLHGIPEDKRSTVPDVQVVWRADVTEAALQDIDRGSNVAALARLVEQLQTTPPGALEALSMPPWTAKRWLSAGADSDDDLADVDGQMREAEGPPASGGQLVLVWRGRKSEVLRASEVEPGQLLIVPSSVGGIGPHGTFDPDGPAAPVRDLGDGVQLLQRGRPSLRLDARVLGPQRGGALAGVLDPSDPTLAETDPREAARDALRAVLATIDDDAPSWLRAIGQALLAKRPRLVRTLDAENRTRWVALGRPVDASDLRRLMAGGGASYALRQMPSDTTTDGEDGSFIGVTSKLDEHLIGVADFAARFATNASLPSSLIAALRWAGRIHDVGKVDRRFQLWLHDGDEVAAEGADVLAKSAMPRQDAAARHRARERAGYPAGQRHELVSLDMAESSAHLRTAVEVAGADWDLVLHLVASHHGWCRPLAPAATVDEPDAVTWRIEGVDLHGSTGHGRARLDSGVVERFWLLVKRYGWHELAYLEAVLRLADHRRSQVEQMQGGAS